MPHILTSLVPLACASLKTKVNELLKKNQQYTYDCTFHCTIKKKNAQEKNQQHGTRCWVGKVKRRPTSSQKLPPETSRRAQEVSDQLLSESSGGVLGLFPHLFLGCEQTMYSQIQTENERKDVSILWWPITTKKIKTGAWLAQSVERATRGLRDVSSSPRLGVEMT